jgi:hypothetical protein
MKGVGGGCVAGGANGSGIGVCVLNGTIVGTKTTTVRAGVLVGGSAGGGKIRMRTVGEGDGVGEGGVTKSDTLRVGVEVGVMLGVKVAVAVG